MLRTILFDLGKVLIPFDFSRAYRRMEELSGLPAGEARSRLVGTDWFRRLETGLIEPQPFAASVQQLLGFECEYPVFCDIWNSIFLPDPLLPETLLENLKRSHRLVLVSNTNAIHFEMLNLRYRNLLRHFDAYILSYRIRAMKPAPEYYSAALEAAEAPAAECLFIDDLPDNVEGARVAGMDAIQFESRPQLEAELRARGLI